MTLVSQISTILDDNKAQQISVINVNNQSDDFDTVIIASGTSSRHNHALMQKCIEQMKQQYRVIPHHYEADKDSQWILIDYNSVVVHLLQDETRQYYDLESLWTPLTEDSMQDVS